MCQSSNFQVIFIGKQVQTETANWARDSCLKIKIKYYVIFGNSKFDTHQIAFLMRYFITLIMYLVKKLQKQDESTV